MQPHEAEQKIQEMEKDIESLVAMVSELYEKVHRVERVLVDEGTVDTPTPEVDEHGLDGLFAEAKAFVQESGRCSVSLLQKQFKITYKRAFVLLDTLEAEGVIGQADGAAPRKVNKDV